MTTIGNYAFSICGKLAEVTVEWTEPLPIEEKVFYSSNTSNATLYVPAGSKSAYQAADYWKDFKEIVEQNTPISKIITFADTNVKTLCVQNWDTNDDGELSEAEAAAVTDLGTVFKENKSIVSFNELDFFSGLTSIGDNAFDYCSSLSSVIIPSNVKSIGNYSFASCNKLTNVIIPSNVVSIGSYAFGWCSKLSSLLIPENVKSIGNQAFTNCSAITTITVNASNTVYDSRNNCNAIIEKASDKLILGCKNTTIPSSVMSIGSHSFENCSGLASITIPLSVTNIESYAFKNCHELTSITIPSSVISIGSYVFENCDKLASISVNSNNAIYDSRNNCNAIIETASNTLIIGCKNATIPSTVTNIGSHAFDYCSGLSSITIPSSVKSIGSYSFASCSGLISVNIPKSVTSIGNYAFGWCGKLTSVSVEWSEPLTIEEKVFYSSNTSNATLYVPAGSKAAYEAADYWKEFKEIVENEPQKYTLEILGHFNPDESHLYDRNGKEYDVTEFAYNEFDEGSYIRIYPFVYPGSFYIREILVNGESVGVWTDENTAPTEYIIERLSCNTTVEFKTYLLEQWRTLSCKAEGPGNVKMYKNDILVGTTPDEGEPRYCSAVFDDGDVLKLVFIPDAGSSLTQFLGSFHGDGDVDVCALLGDVTDNIYTISFPSYYHDDYPLLRCFAATFEGPEPSTANTLSATVPTMLTGNSETLSIGLTNEDALIAFQFDLQLPDGISLPTDEDGDPIATLSSRINGHSLTVQDNGNGKYHFLCYSGNNKAFSGNEGELLSMELLCDKNMAAGTYQSTIKNIIFSDVDKNEINLEDYTFNIEVMDVEPGDVNNDGKLNVMDVVEMVAYIMGDGSDDFVFAAGDLTGDGKINVMDLVRLVDLVMKASASSAPDWTENGMSLRTEADGAIAVKVGDAGRYVASEFIVEVGAGQQLEAVSADKHHSVTVEPVDDSHYKVMAYSNRNSTFKDDAFVTLYVSGEGIVTVRNALLVDESRQGVAFAPTAGGYTTGISLTPDPSPKGEGRAYTLSGQRVSRYQRLNTSMSQLPKGVYIVNGKKQVIRDNR